MKTLFVFGLVGIVGCSNGFSYVPENTGMLNPFVDGGGNQPSNDANSPDSADGGMNDFDSSVTDVNTIDNVNPMMDNFVPKDSGMSNDVQVVPETGGPCIPKTCFTLNVLSGKTACGIHDDECGNYIRCPNCDDFSEPHVSCGGQDVNPDGTFKPASPGYCGGDCVRSSSVGDNSYCINAYGDKLQYAWVCSTTSLSPPPGFGSYCVTKTGEKYPYMTATNKWCCPG